MPRKKKEHPLETASRPKRKPGSVTSKPTAKKPKAAASKSKPAAKPALSKTPKAKKTAVARPGKKAHASASAKKNVKPKSSWKPAKYGETQVVAFIRDPNCIFVYWEIAAQKLEQVKNELKHEYEKSRLILRMFRSQEDGSADLIYEIEVSPEDMNRYLPVHEPGRGYFVEVARKAPSGKVVVIARSNALTAPIAGFSPQVAPGWVPPPELEDYLADELEVGPENLPPPGALGGISSAEAQRRRAKFRDTFSSFGRQN
jgi:hypothetical protein